MLYYKFLQQHFFLHFLPLRFCSLSEQIHPVPDTGGLRRKPGESGLPASGRPEGAGTAGRQGIRGRSGRSERPACRCGNLHPDSAEELRLPAVKSAFHAAIQLLFIYISAAYKAICFTAIQYCSSVSPYERDPVRNIRGLFMLLHIPAVQPLSTIAAALHFSF